MRVKDSGVGIPEIMIPKIFKMFAQLGPTLDRTAGGLGVGLTIVQQLVELHGGTVVAESKGLSKGSTFSVRLPAVDPVPESVSSDPGHAARGGGSLRILIVEDSEDLGYNMRILLEMSGYDVRLAPNGYVALEVAEEFEPQVVLLDIGLPGLNGYEVAERLRALPALRNCLIVGISGYGQKEDRERSLKAGFNNHYLKPVDFDALSIYLEAVAQGRDEHTANSRSRESLLQSGRRVAGFS